MKKIVKKICLIGPERVGKSSLFHRFINNSFSAEYRSTIGVQISQKSVSVTPDKNIEFILWDVEGFNGLRNTPSYHLLGSSACIFVADISRADTMSDLAQIYSNINSFYTFEVKPIIALNKFDLVSSEGGLEKLEDIKSSNVYDNISDFYLTSAKNGGNVEEIFNTLAKKYFM